MKHIITILLIITSCLLQTTYAQICINNQNNVGISNDNPTGGKLDVLNNTSSNNRISINNQNSYSGTSEKVGISNTVSQHGNNSKVGLSNIVTQNSNNGAYSIYNNLTSNGGNGSLVGTSNWVINAAGAKSNCHGLSTNVVLEASANYAYGQAAGVEVKNNTGTVYSTRNGITVNGPYSVDANSTYNQMIDNNAGATGYRRGFFNQIRTEGGNGYVRGIHNVIETNGTTNNRNVFGIDNELDCEATGTKIGINNKIENKWSGGTLKGIQNHVTSRNNAENVRGIESTVEKNHGGVVYGFLSRLTLPSLYGNSGTNYGIYSTIYKEDGDYSKNNESIYGVYSLVNENFAGGNDTEFYSGFFKGQDVYIQKRLYVGGEFKAFKGEGSQGSIQKIENPLQKLNELNPFYFNNLKGEKRYSFNTEEIRNVYPELTKEVADPTHPEKEKKTAIDYLGLIPILVDAINKQSDKIAALENQVLKIDSLENKILSLMNVKNDNLLDVEATKTAGSNSFTD